MVCNLPDLHKPTPPRHRPRYYFFLRGQSHLVPNALNATHLWQGLFGTGLCRLGNVRLLGQGVFCLLITLITHPAVANLPTPPIDDYATQGKDWIQVGQTLGVKAAHLFLLLLGVALLGGIASGMLKGYHAAQERQETSHFFKAVGIGIICAALGTGLLYGAHLIISEVH